MLQHSSALLMHGPARPRVGPSAAAPATVVARRTRRTTSSFPSSGSADWRSPAVAHPPLSRGCRPATARGRTPVAAASSSSSLSSSSMSGSSDDPNNNTNGSMNSSAGGDEGDVVVVGDIGGTNARLSLWRCDRARGRHEELFTRVYPVADHDAFERAYAAFMAEPEARPHKARAAALAVAGAVANNRCRMTNTPWVIDGDELTRELGYRVRVLNDFEAVGYGVPALDPAKDLIQVSGAPPGSSSSSSSGAAGPPGAPPADENAPSAAARRRAPKVVMGPGTGLGAAQLFFDSGVQDYVVVPGEGAHATFAPRGWRQTALAAWAAPRLGGHVEIEAVACGGGLELIYQFLLSDDDTYGRPGDMPQAPRSAAEITSLAAEKQDAVAVETVDIFLAIVGAEAGHMALRALAYGGVYIAGGIVPRLLNRVARGGLKDAFLMPRGRGRFRQILGDVPLYIVTNTKVGLIGSRQVALGLLREQEEEEKQKRGAAAAVV